MTAELYEVRIHEPAVADGLFPRPERYRYTNMRLWRPVGDDGVLWLRHGQGEWPFVDGRCDVYDCGTDSHVPAEIVGEIDPGRMERDRFEVLP